MRRSAPALDAGAIHVVLFLENLESKTAFLLGGVLALVLFARSRDDQVRFKRSHFSAHPALGNFHFQQAQLNAFIALQNHLKELIEPEQIRRDLGVSARTKPDQDQQKKAHDSPEPGKPGEPPTSGVSWDHSALCVCALLRRSLLQD